MRSLDVSLPKQSAQLGPSKAISLRVGQLIGMTDIFPVTEQDCPDLSFDIAVGALLLRGPGHDGSPGRQ
jgi:hypothetical protein